MRVFLKLPSSLTSLAPAEVGGADAVIVDGVGLGPQEFAAWRSIFTHTDRILDPTQYPHPEVAAGSAALEGGLQNPRRSLEPSFEAADAAPQDESEDGGVGSRPRRLAILVRTSVVTASRIEAELAAIMTMRPDAIVLPVEHGRDVANLGAQLAVHEAENEWPDGATRIVALLDRGAAVLNAGSLVGSSARLIAIGWDADTMAHDLGITDADGRSPDGGVLALVRAQVRLAAAAAGVVAVETAYPDSDAARFRARVAEARRDGFGAIVAASAEQSALAKR